MIQQISILLFFFSCFYATAQTAFFRQNTIPVMDSGTVLKNPWAGGLNCPQFSEIDLNGDGKKDLFVFDKSGNNVLTFINRGIKDSVDYVFAPQYISRFPVMHDFAILADYNCDGKEDIFTYSSAGMAVYRNDYNVTDGLKFTRITSLLYSQYGPNYVNLYVSPTNIPAFADIDNDGDLDILTVDILGTFVEFHQNISQEQYGNCDSLKYSIGSYCWGNFAGSSSANSVMLGVSCKMKTNKMETVAGINRPEHAGTTLSATLDIDNDGDKELVIGDILSDNLLLLINGGDSADANIISQDNTFPSKYSKTFAVKLTSLPSAYFIDVNNDGKKDLLVSPNVPGSSENFKGVWYYKNTGTSTLPDYVFQRNSFLQDEMLETGEGNNPVFFDYNADGLQDLLIGNFGYYSDSGKYSSALSLYKNTGSSVNPAFQLITRNYASLDTLTLNGIYPAVGDLDNDGDLDLLLGESMGTLLYFTNVAGAGKIASFVLSSSKYKNIDVGYASAPQIADVDRDGKLDLLVGKSDGTIAYFQNKGTPSIPDFTSSPTTAKFGGIDVRQKGYNNGYCTPFLVDSSGTSKLFAGSAEGIVYLFDSIDGNLNGTFRQLGSNVISFFEGEKISVSAGDINGDKKYDLLIGNYNGGCAIYTQSLIDNNTKTLSDAGFENHFSLFPNPAKTKLIIQTAPTENQSGSGLKYDFFIYDFTGREVISGKTSLASKEINVSSLSTGLYLCRIFIPSTHEVFLHKVVIENP